MSDPNSAARRHEWIYPEAPSPRQCRFCLKSEYELATGSQEIGICEAVKDNEARPQTTGPIERVTHAVREEIVRQYRENERGKSPVGPAYYEEYVSPWLIAKCAIAAYEEGKAS